MIKRLISKKFFISMYAMTLIFILLILDKINSDNFIVLFGGVLAGYGVLNMTSESGPNKIHPNDEP